MIVILLSFISVSTSISMFEALCALASAIVADDCEVVNFFSTIFFETSKPLYFIETLL